MRIYLDTCILQDLKKESNAKLLDLIFQSKGELIYCFSEAHLYDLSRDDSDEKFSDMKFMEQVVDHICFYYDKQILVDNCTPREYYNRYHWPSTTSTSDLFADIYEDGTLGGLFKFMESLLSVIPLNFKEVIPQDQLPADMPENIKTLFDVSTKGEWMSACLNYADKLTAEQKAFKEQLQYLHKSQIANYLNVLGIEGFDGQQITDKEKLRASFSDYYIKQTNGKGKNRYDLFTDMYNGLEFFGLVQGKPRKQKMINMINDGKHAFFGGFCDIVVSKDEDFINKTKFMYNLHEIDTQVLNLTEFDNFLSKRSTNKTLVDLFNELSEHNGEILFEVDNDEQHIIGKRLNHTYFGYFNASLSYSNGAMYFTKENIFCGTATLIKEIAFCVNQLVKELGIDYFGNGEFVKGDFENREEKEWRGRTWLINNEIVVDLKFSDRLYIILGEPEKHE